MLTLALRERRVRVLTHSGSAVIPKRTISSLTFPFASNQPSGPIAPAQSSLPPPVSTYSDLLSPLLSSLGMDSEIGCTALVLFLGFGCLTVASHFALPQQWVYSALRTLGANRLTPACSELTC